MCEGWAQTRPLFPPALEGRAPVRLAARAKMVRGSRARGDHTRARRPKQSQRTEVASMTNVRQQPDGQPSSAAFLWLTMQGTGLGDSECRTVQSCRRAMTGLTAAA